MYDAVTWYTGNLCGDSFLPGGKIADFFGFQYLRDLAPNQTGHSTVFVTYCSKAFLSILNPTQTAILTAYAQNYSTYQNLTTQYVMSRFPIYKALRSLLNGDLPSGKSGLNKDALLNYSQYLYKVDANVTLMKAAAFAQIINSLDSSQRKILDGYVSGGFNSWPVNKTNCDSNMMGLASEMFAWYAGNSTSDIYFAPERINDYFGAFYFKDGPGYGTKNYSVSTHITGAEGDNFYSYLNSTEQGWYDVIMPDQISYQTKIVDVRSKISTELRKALANQSINQTLILELESQYGAYDGYLTYLYATVLSSIRPKLNSTVIEKLHQIPAVASLAGYLCATTSGMAFYNDGFAPAPTSIESDFLLF